MLILNVTLNNTTVELIIKYLACVLVC